MSTAPEDLRRIADLIDQADATITHVEYSAVRSNGHFNTTICAATEPGFRATAAAFGINVPNTYTGRPTPWGSAGHRIFEVLSADSIVMVRHDCFDHHRDCRRGDAA